MQHDCAKRIDYKSKNRGRKEKMRSTQNKEKTTQKVEKLESDQSTKEKGVAIRQSGLQVLSTLSGEVTSEQIDSLNVHSRRLMNVAHSFVEEREKAYLNDDLSSMTVSPSDFSIDAVCKLTEQSLSCIKLAMELNNSKVKNFKEIMSVLK